MDKLFGKQQKSHLKFHTCVGQYIVTKHSWRGSYQRVLTIYADGKIDTLEPSGGSKVTNSYSFAKDPDIDGITVGPGPEEFSLSCRPDKKTRKFGPMRLSCHHRAALLTDLYQCVAALAECNRSPLAFNLLGTPEQIPGAKWCHSTGTWTPVVLKLTGYCLECRDATGGSIIWRMDYAALGAPALSVLSSDASGAPGSLPPGLITGNSVGVLCLDARPTFRRPKVFACGTRDAVVAAIRKAAGQRLGLDLLVDTSQQHHTGAEVLNALQQTEQQLASSVHEVATGEWEVQRLKPCSSTDPTLSLLAAPHLSARPVVPVPPFVPAGSPPTQVARRLAVTRCSLIERNGYNYQVITRRPLTAVASLARFVEDPKLFGVEWLDGSPPSLFLSPARDEVLAALLDAAQNAQGLPVAVLPGLKSRGDGLAQGRGTDVDVTKWALEELISRAKEVYPALVHSSRMLYTVSSSQGPSQPLAPHPVPVGPESGTATPAESAVCHGQLALQASPPSMIVEDSKVAADPAADGGGSVKAAGPPTRQLGHAEKDSSAVQEAVALLMDMVYDFCACVGASGVPLLTRLDGQVAASLVALLPLELQQGLPPPAFMPADDIKQSIMVLQCLQRLSSSPECMDTLLALPNVAPRLWAVYACGDEGVAAEVVKLFLRWWTPHTTRRGTVPWKVAPFGPPHSCKETDINSEPSAEELSLSKSAKGLCFSPKVLATRCKQLLAPLKRAAPNTAAGAEGLADARSAGLASAVAPSPASGAATTSTPCSPLLSMAVVEAAAAIAVVPCSATTSTRLLQEVLTEAAALGRPLFALFHHPAGRVADGASLLMREIADSGASAAAPMRHAALREGAFLFHLLRAVDDADARAAALSTKASTGPDADLLLGDLQSTGGHHAGAFATAGSGGGDGGGGALLGTSAAAALSRELVASWADQYAPALALLKRVLPPGLIRCLNAPRLPSAAPAAPSPLPPTNEASSAGNPSHPTPHTPSRAQVTLHHSPSTPTPTPAGTTINDGAAMAPSHTPGGLQLPSTGSSTNTGSLLQPPFSATQPSMAPGGAQGTEYATNVPRTPAPVAPGGAEFISTHQLGVGGASAQGGVLHGYAGDGSPPAASQVAGAVGPTSAAAPMAGSQGAGLAAHGAGAASATHAQGPMPMPNATAAVSSGDGLGAVAGVAAGAQAPTGASTHTSSGATPPSHASSGVGGIATHAKGSGGGLKGNWGALWHALAMDHHHAGLIWNEATRGELRGALAKEETALRSRRQQLSHQTVWGRTVVVLSAWNFSEFEVTYASLQHHLCIGGIYIRLLLEGADTGAVSKLPQPRELFSSLHHHLLSSDSHLLTASTQSHELQPPSSQQRTSWTAAAAAAGTAAGGFLSSQHTEEVQLLCIRAMAAVYHAHAGAVGPCEGLNHLVRIMDQTTRRPVRQHLLLLMAALLQPKSAQQSQQAQRVARINGYALHRAGGTELLVDLAATAHEATEPSTASAALTTLTNNTAGGSINATDGLSASGQAGRSSAWEVGGAGLDGAGAASAARAGNIQSAVVGNVHTGSLHTGGVNTGVASTQVLTASAHCDVEEGRVCEWFCYLPPHLVHDLPVAVGADGAMPAAKRLGPEDSSEGAATTPPPCPLPPSGLVAVGPLSKPDLARLFQSGSVGMHSMCWAEGQGGAGGALPLPLASIRELRWHLSSGPPVLSLKDTSLTSLELLHTLAALLPATEVDEFGVEIVVEPLPKTLCMLASSRCLSRLCQLLLTFDQDLVPSVASLLECVLKHNEERLSRLYSTGAFYFALAYPGSNLVEVARLLQLTHLRQAPRVNMGMAYSSVPLAQQSYLGHVLPESLLFCLDTYGAEVFASVLRGNNDTPELLWTHAMRFGRLLPQLSQHLGNLRRRLAHNWGGIIFDYTPVPSLSYPELREELWCHRYYLRNLCNESRFPEWHIRDHVQLLQSLLTEWRAELARQPLALSEAEACAVLGLKPGPNGIVAEDELRRAYRAMARANHPDKNPLPQTRAAFLAGQAAYERLLTGAAGGQGPQVWRLLLLLRAQVLLFRRYPDVLAPYKYPGFTLLMEVLNQQPSAQHWSRTDQVQLAQAGTELAWLVCRSSVLNAEELARSGGLKVLGSLVQRWIETPAAQTLIKAGQSNSSSSLDWGVQLLPLGGSQRGPTLALTSGESSTSDNHSNSFGAADKGPRGGGTPGGMDNTQTDGGGSAIDADAAANAVVATHALRGCAGLAAVPSGATQLLVWPALLLDLLQITTMPQAHGASEAALLTLANLSAHAAAQQRLLELGALVYLVPILFRYDTTLGPATLSSFKLPFGAARHPESQPSTPAPPSNPTTHNSSPNPATPHSTPTASASNQTSTSSISRAQKAARLSHSPISTLGHLDVLDTLPLGRANGELEAFSYRALLVAQALGRITGLLPEPHQTPQHPPAVAALEALLTPPIAQRLSVPEDLPRLLAVLNGTGIEAARVIWSPEMRAELLTGLASMRDALHHGTPSVQPPLPADYSTQPKTGVEHSQGVLVAGGGGHLQTEDGGDTGGANDTSSQSSAIRAPQRWRGFTLLHGELVVGGVYVRVYNAKPMVLPADAPGFCKALVSYLYEKLVLAPSKQQQQQQQSASALPSLSTAFSPPSFLLSPSLTSSCCSVMRALSGLMEVEPRLLGLLASRSAMAPLITPLRAAATSVASALSAASRASPDQFVAAAIRSDLAAIPSRQAELAHAPPITSMHGDSKPGLHTNTVFQAALASAPLAEAALTVLQRLVSHAGCVTAMASTPAAAHAAAQLLHAPPSVEVLLAALRLIKALAGLHTVGTVVVDYGGTILLTDILLDLALSLHPVAAPQSQQQQHHEYQQLQQPEQPSEQQQGAAGQQEYSHALHALPHGWRLWGWKQHETQQGSHSAYLPASVVKALNEGSSNTIGGLDGANDTRGTDAPAGTRAAYQQHGKGSAQVAEAAEEAAGLLALLLASPSHGMAVTLLLQRILPLGLVASLASLPPATALSTLVPPPPTAPSSALATFSAPWASQEASSPHKQTLPAQHENNNLNSTSPAVVPDAAPTGASMHSDSGTVAAGGGIETPELIWDRSMAEHAAVVVSQLASACFRQQQQQQGGGGLTVWVPPPGILVRYARLEGEVMVGGVYCRLFLKDPSYPLRDPRGFADALIEALLEAAHANATQQQQGRSQELKGHHRLLLLCGCLVALLQQHALLGDHLTTTGYVPRLVSALAAYLPVRASGANKPSSGIVGLQLQAFCGLVRVLHTMSSRLVAAQALALTAAPQHLQVPAPPPPPLSATEQQGAHLAAHSSSPAPPAQPPPTPSPTATPISTPLAQPSKPLAATEAPALAAPVLLSPGAAGNLGQEGAASTVGPAGGARPPGTARPAAPALVNPGALAVLHSMLEGCSRVVLACAAENTGPSPLQSLAGEVCVLVLETLKRVLAQGNRSRDLVVAQALQGDLLVLLLSMLDWRRSPASLSAQQQQQDVTVVVRVQVVDVINLLAEPGAYSYQVDMVLNSSSVWAAYKGQRHDLFLPASAAPGSSVAGLLTHHQQSQQPMQQLQYFHQ